jgi:hypothetical protein
VIGREHALKGALQLIGVRWAGRAEGVSNQEIAGWAFLSVKTVEATLMRVYRTPGAHSRSGLAHALAAAPPDSTQA